MIKNDFLRNLPDQLYLVWDTETEGLNLVRSRPWQISYSLFRGQNRLETVDKFIRWDNINVSKEAADVTGFDLEKYMDLAEDPKKIFEDFGEYLFDDSIINLGHNILGFDIYMDRVARRLSGSKHSWKYLKNSVDTLCLAKGSKSGVKPDFDNFLAWQFAMLKMKGRGNKLIDLAKENDVEVDKNRLHDAAYDTEINYKVFLKYIQIYAI